MSNIQGVTGEYLVAADLCKRGYFAFLSAAGMRYDLVVDVGGTLLRVQVKSCLQQTMQPGHRTPTYLFNISRGYRDGAPRKQLAAGEADLYALVAIDTGEVAYLPAAKAIGKKSIKIRANTAADSGWTKRSNKFEHLSIEKALKEIL